jgi:hypothetical protein
MKAKHATRASMLVRARKEIAWLRKQITKPCAGNYDYRAMLVSIEDCCSSGSHADGHIEIPIETANLMIDAIEKVIGRELKKLGVK